MARKGRGRGSRGDAESAETLGSEIEGPGPGAIEGEGLPIDADSAGSAAPRETVGGASERVLWRAVELPLADPPAGSYIGAETLGHLDGRLNTPEQLTGLRRLHAGLVTAGAKLANGRPVVTKADVLRYVFEQLG